jgi:hypothetical protein
MRISLAHSQPYRIWPMLLKKSEGGFFAQQRNRIGVLCALIIRAAKVS